MAAKSASEKVNDSTGSKYIVMCLGLLIGFVVGFVLLLSSLPVDTGLEDYEAYSSAGESTPRTNSFDFYQLLPGRSIEPDALAAAPVRMNTDVVTEVKTASTSVIEPATRVVPANAQLISPTSYTEVPANFNAQQQSYFLQAGKFRQHEEAQAMRAQVLLLGLEAFIVTREEPGGVIAHRVRVGPYFDQSILTEAKKRLSRGQINYEIVRVTG